MGSHWFEWRNADVHYRKSGMGDPLLLIHDLHGGASSEDFDRNVSFLSSQFTVYRLDLIGFGFSEGRAIRYRARDYTDLIGDFIEHVIGMAAHVAVVGRSCGFVAAAAAQRAALFSNLALISPDVSARSSSRESWTSRVIRETFWLAMIMPPLRTVFRAMMAGAWELGEFLRRTVFDPRCIDRSKLDRLGSLAREPHTLSAYASLEAGFLSTKLEQFLPRVMNPTLFICGCEADRDHVDGIDRCAGMTIGRSGIEQVPRARLWPHYEQPRRTNAVLANFLNAGSAATAYSCGAPRLTNAA